MPEMLFLYLQIKVDDEFASKCGYNIAKLYYNVGEYESSIKYLNKYDQVRINKYSLSYNQKWS